MFFDSRGVLITAIVNLIRNYGAVKFKGSLEIITNSKLSGFMVILSYLHIQDIV